MNPSKLPRRPFLDDVELSILGFGGIVVMDSDPGHARHLVAQAFEKGVNYFDVAPSYGDAQSKLGPALKPYRKDCFLACKTGERTAEGAHRELEESLQFLETDYFDIYQLHAITDIEADVDRAFSKGGAMEPILEAKKAGRIRYLGFSAHSPEAAFAAMDRYDFDSVLFPMNFCCVHRGGFGRQILEAAQSRGMARLALKGMARQQWKDGEPQPIWKKCWYEPLTDPAEAELALRWTLSQPVTAAIPPGEEELFQLAMDIALRFEPIGLEDEERLLDLSRDLNPIFVG